MSNMKCLGNRYCSQYQTTATFFVEPVKDRGSLRHLEVHYENGRKPFRAGIPNSWSDADLVRHVMIEDDGTYPAWEQAARMLGCPTLIRRF